MDPVQYGDLNGPSRLELTNTVFHNSAEIQTGNSIDRMTVDNSTFASTFHAILRGGEDWVVTRGCVFSTTPAINTGAGEDVVVIG